MVAQTAQATGTLGGTPVGNLLVYVLDRALTGSLVIEDHRHRKSAVTFRKGAPVKVKVVEEVGRLSSVLTQMGAIGPVEAESSYLTAQSQGRLHGEVLLEQGLVEPHVLAEALTQQVSVKIEWLCSLRPESVWGYYDGQDFLQNYGGPTGAPADPLTIIWRVLRQFAEPGVMDGALARFGAREARLHPRSRVARFGFSARERGVLDVIRAKPQPVPVLLASGLLPELELKRVLYTLLVTRHLDLGGDAQPVGLTDQASASSVPPPTRSSIQPSSPRSSPNPRATGRQNGSTGAAPAPDLTEFIAEIQARAASIGASNYYEILGVDRSASTTVIQAAFFQLAKKWHPDRLPAALGSAREPATRIFSRMSEAHQVLTNDEQRVEYERLMREGGAAPDEQEMVQRVLRAATAFQKAEVFVRRNNFEEAEKCAALAVECDPEQAEYLALHAELLSMRPERATVGYADLVKMVNQAKRKQPDNMKVRLYRARVLKRAGELELANREYRTIADRDPQNVEAAREVRLFEMRKGKAPTEARKSGEHRLGVKAKSDSPKSTPSDIGQLFGKLFKR